MSSNRALARSIKRQCDDAAPCTDIFTLFPEVESDPLSFGAAARYVLKHYEAKILAA